MIIILLSLILVILTIVYLLFDRKPGRRVPGLGQHRCYKKKLLTESCYKKKLLIESCYKKKLLTESLGQRRHEGVRDRRDAAEGRGLLS